MSCVFKLDAVMFIVQELHEELYKSVTEVYGPLLMLPSY